MNVYGHTLFWSVIVSVLAAVVVCMLILRYGFTRDVDPAGRGGWRPTRVGHGLAAALFGTGVVLAILALSADPLGGKEGYPGLGNALRARWEVLRGRLDAFEDVMARFSSDGVWRARPGDGRWSRAASPQAGAENAAENARAENSRVENLRAQNPRPESATAPPSAAPSAMLSTDMPQTTTSEHDGRAAIAGPPAAPSPQRPATLEPRPASDRAERRTIRSDTRNVVAVTPRAKHTRHAEAIMPPAAPAPVESGPAATISSPASVMAKPPRSALPPTQPDVSQPGPVAASLGREHADAHDRDSDIGALTDKRDKDRSDKPDQSADTADMGARKLARIAPDPQGADPRPPGPLRGDADAKPEVRLDKAKAGVEQPQRGAEPQQPEAVDLVPRLGRVERVDRADRADRPERIERAERIERSDRPERLERIDRPERLERAERIEKVEKIEKFDKFERPERGGKR